MKNRMLMIVIIVVAVVVLVMGAWYVAFCKYGVGPAFPFMKTVDIGDMGIDAVPIAEEQLMAIVNTQEEAEEIAKLYGIVFVSYENGVALYQTDEDPFEVIARGEANGYPQLSINLVRTLNDETETLQMNQQINLRMEEE